jgi:hypothetical protein
MFRKLRLPSPAMAVALAALFVALSGTAVAAGVPALAKRALVAENAKKLGGQTSAQLLATANTAAKQAAESAASQPGPASTVAGLAVIKSAAVGQLNPGQIREFSISCDAGQQVVGGGLSSDALMVIFDSFPSNATTWTASGGNIFGGSPPASVSIWAVCVK